MGGVKFSWPVAREKLTEGSLSHGSQFLTEHLCSGRVVLKGANGNFFFIFAKKLIFSKNGQYFPTEKKIKGKKRKKCGLPTGFKKGHMLDQKQKVFLGWPQCGPP